jgi:L,D-transpeptidase ErfK/SrfK
MRRVWLAVLLGSLAAVPAKRAAAVVPLPVYHEVVGRATVHVVTAGETLGAIARRFGISVRLAARINALSDPNRLHVGQRLLLSNRRIVPATLRDGLVINVGDLTLYWLRGGAVVADFPVGVGRAAWETPPGRYRIVNRRRDPTWHVPPSIQKEMREHGEPVKKKVPPGPGNPLGKYWLQLSVPGYGIHGTNAPWTVGKYTTHGCIRLHPDDIERLFKEVPNGTAVDIINEPVKVARLDGQTVLLEAHPGVSGDANADVALWLDRLAASAIAPDVRRAAATRVLRQAWGVAVNVSRRGAAANAAAPRRPAASPAGSNSTRSRP